MKSTVREELDALVRAQSNGLWAVAEFAAPRVAKLNVGEAAFGISHVAGHRARQVAQSERVGVSADLQAPFGGAQ